VTRRELVLLPGAGLILRSALRASEPENLSYPLRTLDGTLTPSQSFFVRDHFSPPAISIDTWNLRIEGHVEQPYELTFSDLVELPSIKVEAVLECAGNLANGSAVSNGVWEGVSLAMLLAKAGLRPDAAFVLLEGADSGLLLNTGPVLPYSQLVPLSKCMEPSSLIAFKLNDLILPKRNGFPARAVFPGWYGMDSVKWLRRIEVLRAGDRETAFHQSGMNRVYNRVVRTPDGEQVTRLQSLQVKSAVAWPSDGLKLPAGRHLVWGFAWSGNGIVRDIKVSVDGGKRWNAAKFDSRPSDYAWVRWSYPWEAAPGDYVLMSRASDRNGNEQPLQRDAARKDGYELNACMPLHCSVR
jgi:DMSO/TMAO reductase YedYZ molybdopterin-dependent catalytic subunit